MENNLEKQLTPEESLSIITASLERSRKDMLENAGAPMIGWGILVLVFSLAVFFLWNKTGSPAWNFLWFLMCLIGYAMGRFVYGRKEKGVKNHISSSLGKIWAVFGILAISASTLTPLCLYGMLHLLPADLVPAQITSPVTLLIVSLLGSATAATGWILKNGWILAAGLVTGIVGTACAMALPGAHQELILTGVSVIGLILPGLIINKKGSRDA